MGWILANFINLTFGATTKVEAPSTGDLGIQQVSADDAFLKNFLGIVFGAAAAVAILIIVIAGLNIAKSDGNPEEISKGRKTIIFALVGLAIAVSSEGIVYFVLGRL